MLTQIDIYTSKEDTSDLWSDVSVKIHGFIMSRISPEMAEELHKGGLMPFSIFTTELPEYNITRVSVLKDEYLPIINVFDDIKKIRIFGTENNINVLHIEKAPEIKFEDLLNYVTANKYQITFITPAMYKRNGVICYEPTVALYFESVRQKLEKFENIKMTRDEVLEAFADARICDYKLSVKAFLTGGKKIPGIVGEMRLQIPQTGKSRSILAILLAYATYSGVGGSTTQGMGGFALKKVEK